MKVDFGGMPVVIMTIVVIIGVFIFVKLIFFSLWKQSLYAKELKELNEGFVFKAGGWFNDIHLTYPFVKVILNKDDMYKHSKNKLG